MTSDDQSTAERFWRLTGGPTAFPRDIASAAAWALPVHFVELPGLTVAGVGVWLRARGVPVPDLPDRPLRACLVARAGGGVILIDADDPADERRYSAAHEIGHFLRDHLGVRERTGQALGNAALDVLDGLRPATTEERLNALFAETRLSPLTHLLGRVETGDCRSFAADAAEQAADRLALELLAPRAEAERRLTSIPGRVRGDTLDEATTVLAHDFGLPIPVARSYARRLLARRDAARPLRERLGFPAAAEKIESRCRTPDVPPEHHP